MKASIRQLDRILRGEVTRPEALREGIQIPVLGLTGVLLALAAIRVLKIANAIPNVPNAAAHPLEQCRVLQTSSEEM